jgi:type IV secretory pathway VirB10-like protein
MRLTPEETTAERRRDAIRRLQIGGTGLALIALLVGLSTLLTGEVRQEAATAQAQAEAAGTPAPAAPPPGDDPLTAPAAEVPPPAVPSPPQPATGTADAPLVPDLEPDPGLEAARPR